MPRLSIAIFFPLVIGFFGVAALGGEIRFKKTVIDSKFRSEGVAVADVDGDGRLDILAWPLWYRAPDWKPNEISPAKEYDPKQYSNSFLNFADDLDGDGLPDLIVIDFPGHPALWFQNPGKAGGHWTRREIFRSACNESPAYADIDGDGRRELIMGIEPEKQMAWFERGADPAATWTLRAISGLDAPGTHRYWHGLGIGDMNEDGRLDVIINQGWYEAPADRRSGPWTFHREKPGLAGGIKTGSDGKERKVPDHCAQMFAYDFDGDGDIDIASSSAHDYGVWWYERREEGGERVWVRRDIDTGFSQAHAMVMVDMNRDGLPDLVTGKRWWAHHGGDPGWEEPAVLVWFELRRRGGKVEWIRRDIDGDSGVGLNFEVVDINKDGLLDIAIANKKGVFYFEQAPAAEAAGK